MIVHATTLIAIATTGALRDECPTPWTAEKIDPWKGPGTHVWDVLAADGCSLVYLPSSVDGPAFVAWVNEHAPREPSSLTGSGELAYAPADDPPRRQRAVDARAYLPVCSRCHCPIEQGDRRVWIGPVMSGGSKDEHPDRHADAEDCIVALFRARYPEPTTQRPEDEP